MDLMPTDEQEEIAATVTTLLADRLPVIGREPPPSGTEIDPDLWRECAELGWLSIGLPESAGGVGYGVVEEVMLFRELGRGIAPGPFLPGALAAHLAAAAGDADLTASIIAGDTKVALGTPTGPSEIGSTVTGALSVVHTDGAAFMLVCDDRAAALLPTEAVSIEPIDSVEPSTGIGLAVASGVSPRCWAEASMAPIFLRGLVLSAAVATGVATAAVDLAVEYAGQRVQFGKPIGVNQAIKHWCADMKVLADGADAQVGFAAAALDANHPEAAVEATIGKYYADEAARRNCEGAVQVHGAMGFTIEAAPHLYVYRAHLLGRCLAGRTVLLDRIVPRPVA